MRILTVMNLYPPHAFGGYEDLCAGTVRAWRAAGHEVDVLASNWRRKDVPADAPSPGGEHVARALPMYWGDHHALTPPRRVAMAWERRSRRVVARTLETFRPDVLSVWNAGALSFSLFELATQRAVPVVLVLGDRWLEFGPAADGWRARFLDAPTPVDRILAKLAGLPTRTDRLGQPVVACFASEHLRDHAQETTSWHFDDTAVVPHGLDLQRFPAVADPPDRPWHGRLAYVGRLAPEKGVMVAIRALARLPASSLRIVGTGDESYVRRLRAEAQDLGVADRVTFAGEAGPAQLRSAYADADALVFPSQWPEPFGIVPLEAMACGTPVVATGTGGSGEFLVDGVTCMRCTAGDAESLASAVSRLADDRDLRARLRAAGLTVAAWLDRATTATELLAWHRHAADGCAGRRPMQRPMLPPDLF